MTTPIVWTGEQTFQVVGTNRHEDTLRIRSNDAKTETVYRLRLPTLCITYADMRFVNDIGGVQARWPAAAVYGPQFFNPPVAINGLTEVERLTWIRGAHCVIIGPRETEIEWHARRELVIPRLRIGELDPLEATLVVENARVEVEPELLIDISQYADGRQIGGVRVVKRHPDWVEPAPDKPNYRLWVRVVDCESQRPLVEAKLALCRWRRDAFEPVEEAWTDATGSIVRDHRPAEVLEAAVLAMEGWRATPKVWRGQPGQDVNLLVSAARLRAAKYPTQVPGAARKLFAAVYNLDPGDTLEWLAAAFRYRDVAELAALGGAAALNAGALIALPGWRFIHAQRGDSLISLAAEFQLDPGWPRTVGRRHHPAPLVPLEHEIVAVPTPDFIAGRSPA